MFERAVVVHLHLMMALLMIVTWAGVLLALVHFVECVVN
jgi:hypothetical protein